MYICIHILCTYICTHIHTFTPTSICICMYINIYVQSMCIHEMYICMQMDIHIHLHICIYVYAFAMTCAPFRFAGPGPKPCSRPLTKLSLHHGYDALFPTYALSHFCFEHLFHPGSCLEHDQDLPRRLGPQQQASGNCLSSPRPAAAAPPGCTGWLPRRDPATQLGGSVKLQRAYLYMYISIYVCMYTYVYRHILTYMYVYVDASMYTYIYTHIGIYICIHVQVPVVDWLNASKKKDLLHDTQVACLFMEAFLAVHLKREYGTQWFFRYSHSTSRAVSIMGQLSGHTCTWKPG